MLRNKTFAPEFCSLVSNWFDMREQAPGQIGCKSAFQEQAPSCVLKFGSREMTCIQLGCFIIQFPRRVLRVYWLGYLPGSVLQERAAGASSLVCTGWGTYPGACCRSVLQEQAPSCVPVLKEPNTLENRSVIRYNLRIIARLFSA